MLKAIQQSSRWSQFQQNLPQRQSFELDGFFCYLLTIKSWLKFLYIPGIDQEIPATTWKKLKQLAKQTGASFIHLEPYKKLPSFSGTRGLKSPFNYIEPHTLVLDLKKSPEKLLEEMKPKGRYNIRLSQKKSLEIKPEANVDNFYKLLTQTTSRDGFSGASKNYYQTMLDQLGEKNCKLWTAFYQNEPVASLICTFHKNTATYYYGASSNQHRNLMAPYLLQWHAIEFSQQAGYDYYDFLGVAPPNQTKHKLAGVSSFKNKFGGQVIEFSHALDYPTKLRYYLYWLFKKLKA